MIKFIVNFKTMNKILPLVLILIICSCQTNKTLESLKWMEGQWIIPDDTLYQRTEEWSLISEKEMIGFGMTVDNSDTIFFEKLSITTEGSDTYFNADIGDGVVKFKLIESKDERWVFENPNHDFPKRIIYKKEGEEMVAFATAEETSLKFRFKKSD